MGNFQIMTPGGYKVEVRADDEASALESARKNWQTMPRLIGQNGDTRIFERPNGQQYIVSPNFSSTDPKQIKQALEGSSAAEISSKSIDESLLSQYPVAARAGEFSRGPMLGSFTDELIGKTFGEDAKTGARALSGAMQRQRPGQTLALNLGGGLTEAVGLAAAAPASLLGAAGAAIGSGPRVAQIGRGLLSGATAGAIGGGIYGAGEGTDAESRAQMATTGATTGAAFGGLLGGGVPVAKDAVSNVIGLFRRSDVAQIAKEFGISQDAAKVIKMTFDQGGDIDAAVASLNKAGSEAMLADAGVAAQVLLDATAQSGGRAGQQARNAIGDRMTRTSDSLTATLDGVAGPAPLGPQSAVNAIAERTGPARTEAYGLAYNTPIDYAAAPGRKIEDVLRRVQPRILVEAIEEANSEMLSRNQKNQQIMASIGDDGSVIYSSPPNVQQLDEIKKHCRAWRTKTPMILAG